MSILARLSEVARGDFQPMLFDQEVEWNSEATVQDCLDVAAQVIGTSDKKLWRWGAVFAHPAGLELLYQLTERHGKDWTWIDEQIWDRFVMRQANIETYARASRRGVQLPHKRHRRILPKWYRQYLASDYWVRNVRERVIDYYESCAACGSVDEPEVHHKHYESLGRERVPSDVALFCKHHHQIIQTEVAIRIPVDCPREVMDILQSEACHI